MTGMSAEQKEMLRGIPHKDMDFYENDTKCDFRAIICGNYREDTRSRIILSSDYNIEQVMIRLPPVEDAQEYQDYILRIARRRLGDKAGCYGRSGNLHIKYPHTGTLFKYDISEFISDYKGFKQEVVEKIDFA